MAVVLVRKLAVSSLIVIKELVFIERNDFVIGDTYYIRIYNLNYLVNQNAQSLYLYQPIPEPEDNCLSAEILTVSDQSCAFTSYDNNLGGATETLTPTDACSAGPYLDLWYKFEVIDATVAIKTNAYQGGNLAIAAFTGTSCSALNPVQCVNASGNGEAEFLYLTGLTIGDTIFIRVYDANLANTPINFSICVYTPPTNDFVPTQQKLQSQMVQIAVVVLPATPKEPQAQVDALVALLMTTFGIGLRQLIHFILYNFQIQPSYHQLWKYLIQIATEVNLNVSKVTNLAHLNSLLDKVTISEYLALTIIMVLVAFKFVFQSHLLIYYVIML
ncbi:MAG: hypothetical protein IPO48_13470 [Saprospiraceae bacterium]|nr:hypothetical protein [Saprospiraceae bacterium]